MRGSRRIRVLEEWWLPRLRVEIRALAQHLGERERETFYRPKRSKQQRISALKSYPASADHPV